MSDDIERPSFGKWLEFISLPLLAGVFGLRVGHVTDALLTISLGGGAVGIAMVGYLIQRYEYRLAVEKHTAEEQAKARVLAEQRSRERQEVLEAEIRQEKRTLDECISCEGPLCTTGALEWRNNHKVAKREMWDWDGKPVHRDCFNHARKRFPVPGIDRLAFPPRSFAKEAAAKAETERRECEERKRRTIAAFNDPDAHIEHLRENLINPATREEDPMVRRALDEALKARESKPCPPSNASSACVGCSHRAPPIGVNRISI